ncbi:Gfd1p LALA0_S06e04940g [Lachancea lanzarotensis]|uniref:LALA0S06e04940g1_1 n=1 Tax=Lachancea lanzarotensis TaxID=1245769 RepID=A0A0C7MYI5_9SACH|nr:uncharacterized protein LALA0_S06e04940g [Lachancea lanzarotensis]CEP62836.1 LALA0S06e04940g1_1 [Lachancea lanzarotensis]
MSSTTQKSDGGSKGLGSSIWATADEKDEKKKQFSEVKSDNKTSGRKRNAKNSKSKGQNESSDVSANVNALAARLGMVDVGKVEEKVRRKSRVNESALSGKMKKPQNPLAMRLGMVDVGEEVVETSEDSGSDGPSRPSTSDKANIFDRIKPKPQRQHMETEKPAQSSQHETAKPHSISASKKSEILKRKIEEQRKIRNANIRKAQQFDLLQDFLKDDDDKGWEEDL